MNLRHPANQSARTPVLGGYLIGMWFRRRKQEIRQDPEIPEGHDARAYLLVEEARLRCERLRGQADRGTGQAKLERLHRELGLAGLCASSNLPRPLRLALLGTAHERCARPAPDATDPLEALASSIRTSERAVRRGAGAPGLSDHLHLAHVHLLRGQELLEELSGASRRRSDAIDARQYR